MFGCYRVRVCRIGALLGCLLGSVFFAVSHDAIAADIKGRLVIVTSFPERLFARYKTAFERKYPDVRVHFRSRKTSAAISFIQERTDEPVDLFWASAPDAFEVLKKSGHLARLSENNRLTQKVGRYPLDDTDGYYRGFAVSGYGLMWNEVYFKAHQLEAPSRWSDLTKASYFRHVGISAPSRSGTTHLIVETILQAEGWEKGWATLLEIGGNLATVTARSFGVPDGIRSGRFGVGLVIDFFGLSAMASGAPVVFRYPEKTAFLPANIAIVTRATNLSAAEAFIEFIRSREGQMILFEPEIRRLPIRPEAYANAPEGYPNPFVASLVERGIAFDRDLSRRRYHLLNALFDTIITYRVKSLNRVWASIHQAEAMLQDNTQASLLKRLKQARELASYIPVSAVQAENSEFSGIFRRRKPGLSLPAKQLKLQKYWEQDARQRMNKALEITRQIINKTSAVNGIARP